MITTNSDKLFKESEKHIPGGVNSPVRAGKAVGVNPLIIKRADKGHIFDEDGNELIDFIGSYGPMILGHNNPIVKKEIVKALEDSLSFGAATKKELEMAVLIKELLPSIEMLRMVNSGTEATMSAIRLARGYTKRDKIVKFVGNYHGHGDSLLVQAGSGIATQGISSSSGVPDSIIENTLVLNYNDFEQLEELFKTSGKDIAAVIVELVSGNMGVVPGNFDFMKRLREITKEYGVVLIVDEVMTGFRVSIGGAQKLYKIEGDLICLGKIIGGGMPIGAFGGKKEIMERLSPLGDVYQAGTLSGNPIAMTAGITTLKYLKDNPKVYLYLEELGDRLENGINLLIDKYKIDATVNRVGSMMTLFFTRTKVTNFSEAKTSDEKAFARFYKEMLNLGLFFPPSQYEAFFLSNEHTIKDIDKTISCVEKVFEKMNRLE
ncbi:Glutamate-1-semialdehyde 2,1-aminomutase [Clostridium vincentii]|uniref:Glutamate-1-semialdehyde 2,1-aminomutase n=1 Tax=Clostridium vincentii TaxID=52704 RepID=A0A2T0BEB0_9CLOT|nr:glutamate-1-semialdehyde 2,1-aminomutase [Clostridium vincentii]PRR82215.1 Glutamate-1-semialdehyde 2,1-aminomutase [Clostridium vincentii]